MKLQARPLSYSQCCEFIETFHRHHKPPQGWKFGVAAFRGSECVGVVAVGRPVARAMDDGSTLEVTRLCSTGEKNVCSFLYGRARQIAFLMGYARIITYILESESGISLKAAGWNFERDTRGGSWSRPSRERKDKAPLEPKKLYISTNYQPKA